MKTYKVSKTGNIPAFVAQYADKYDGKPANRDTFAALDSDITFIVVDCREAYGNTGADKTGWLCSKTNSGNDWNIRFEIK